MKKEYRNVIRTKKRIRATFIELLEEKKGIEYISVCELAERADVSKSTFYYHYEDIYGVAEEIEGELIGNLLGVLEQVSKEKATKYEEYLKSIIDFLRENEDMYRKAICATSSVLFLEKIKTVLTKSVLENSKNTSSQNENVRYVQVRFLVNACVETISDYLKGRLNVSLEQIGEIILQMIAKVM